MIHNHPRFYLNLFYLLFYLLNFFLQGVKDFSVPVGLDAKIKVDLVVVGSVAVSEKGDKQFWEPYDIANLPH